MTYEALLVLADAGGMIVKEKPLTAYDGLIKNNTIAIREDIETDKEKSCVLAEEIGHYYTTTGDILDQSNTTNCKQEYHARLYGYNLKIGLLGLIDAFEYGCKNLHEIADFLNVTERYLIDAIDCYRKKYGTCIKSGNYIIYFIPNLGVMKVNAGASE